MAAQQAGGAFGTAQQASSDDLDDADLEWTLMTKEQKRQILKQRKKAEKAQTVRVPRETLPHVDAADDDVHIVDRGQRPAAYRDRTGHGTRRRDADSLPTVG